MSAERHPRAARGQSREILALVDIKTRHPELAQAADLHIELLQAQRRVQSRLRVPWIEVDRGWLVEQQKQGRPLVRFADLPLEWSDARLMVRQTADTLRRFDLLDTADYAGIQRLIREGHRLEPVVMAWYTAKACPDDPARTTATAPDVRPDALDQVLVFALRPFLARCAEVILPTLDLAAWTRPYCPLCGGDPEMAILTASGDRALVCGRCTGAWPFDGATCPFCGNTERERLKTFTAADPAYRIEACDACRRYIKAVDSRRTSRPFMLAVDSVATLPLDAAAMQKGYVGG